MLASGHWFEVISRAAQRGGLGEGQQIIARLSKERTFQTALEEVEVVESLLAKEGVEIQVRDVLGVFLEECTNQGLAISEGLESLGTFEDALSRAEGKRKEQLAGRQESLTGRVSESLDSLKKLVELTKEFPFLISSPQDIEPSEAREMFYKVRAWVEKGQRGLGEYGLGGEFKDQANTLLEIGYLRRLE